MAVPVKSHHDDMHDFGTSKLYRIEKLKQSAWKGYAVDKDGKVTNPGVETWGLYERVDTGAKVDEKGNVTEPGLHPHHKGDDGKAAPTHSKFIWKWVAYGTEAEVRAQAEKLAK